MAASTPQMSCTTAENTKRERLTASGAAKKTKSSLAAASVESDPTLPSPVNPYSKHAKMPTTTEKAKRQPQTSEKHHTDTRAQAISRTIERGQQCVPRRHNAPGPEQKRPPPPPAARRFACRLRRPNRHRRRRRSLRAATLPPHRRQPPLRETSPPLGSHPLGCRGSARDGIECFLSKRVLGCR